MPFHVNVTLEAEREAEAILDWLMAHEAGEAGFRWFAGMEEAMASLANMPRRCKLAVENGSVDFEVRELLYGQDAYRLLFTIENDTVYVLHIRHGRRRPLTRLRR